jgi:hypothetical protein
MRNSGLSLRGFLPPHAFAMGKVSTTPLTSPLKSPLKSTEVLSAAAEEGLCAFCGDRVHLARRQDSDSPFFFVTDPLTPGGPESELLPKILDAMKLDPGSVRLAVLTRPMSEMSPECREAALKECLGARPGVLVAFGPLTAREAVIGVEGWSVVVTEGLAEMARRPERKKTAWEDLKRALQLSGQMNKKEFHS